MKWYDGKTETFTPWVNLLAKWFDEVLKLVREEFSFEFEKEVEEEEEKEEDKLKLYQLISKYIKSPLVLFLSKYLSTSRSQQIVHEEI